MIVTELLKNAYKWGPVLFGVGFVAPFVAQSMDAAALSAPAGLTNIQLGLVVGLIGGSIAKLRGRWI
jgi:hypothetical protein